MNIKKLNEEIENVLQESTINTYGDQIDFDTFGGAITIKSTDTIGEPKEFVKLSLDVSNRDTVYFKKDVDNTTPVKDIWTEIKEDKKDILNALKPLCDEFDNKIKSLFESKGYILEEI